MERNHIRARLANWCDWTVWQRISKDCSSRELYLHLGNGSLGARVGPESREGGLCALDHEHGGMRGVQPSREKSSYSLLDILVGLASWEVRSALECRRRGEDVRAVNESVRVVSELSHSTEDELEPVL